MPGWVGASCHVFAGQWLSQPSAGGKDSQGRARFDLDNMICSSMRFALGAQGVHMYVASLALAGRQQSRLGPLRAGL